VEPGWTLDRLRRVTKILNFFELLPSFRNKRMVFRNSRPKGRCYPCPRLWRFGVSLGEKNLGFSVVATFHRPASHIHETNYPTQRRRALATTSLLEILTGSPTLRFFQPKLQSRLGPALVWRSVVPAPLGCVVGSSIQRRTAMNGFQPFIVNLP
jgi:hypothetical protein